jgi:hypothetical protein
MSSGSGLLVHEHTPNAAVNYGNLSQVVQALRKTIAVRMERVKTHALER